MTSITKYLVRAWRAASNVAFIAFIGLLIFMVMPVDGGNGLAAPITAPADSAEHGEWYSLAASSNGPSLRITALVAKLRSNGSMPDIAPADASDTQSADASSNIAAVLSESYLGLRPEGEERMAHSFSRWTGGNGGDIKAGEVILGGHGRNGEYWLEVYRNGEVVNVPIDNSVGWTYQPVLSPAVKPHGPVLTTWTQRGSSAGLALTLMGVDIRTEGDLTGGRRIAATGTVTADGGVNGVSEVHAKVRAAVREGVEVIFVANADLFTAQHAAGNDAVTIIGVSTVGQAIDYLCQTGATDAVCALRQATNPPQTDV
jgi:hypothetical protein